MDTVSLRVKLDRDSVSSPFLSLFLRSLLTHFPHSLLDFRAFFCIMS